MVDISTICMQRPIPSYRTRQRQYCAADSPWSRRDAERACGCAQVGYGADSALARIATIRFSGTRPAIDEIREARDAYQLVHLAVEAALAMH